MNWISIHIWGQIFFVKYSCNYWAKIVSNEIHWKTAHTEKKAVQESLRNCYITNHKRNFDLICWIDIQFIVVFYFIIYNNNRTKTAHTLKKIV